MHAYQSLHNFTPCNSQPGGCIHPSSSIVNACFHSPFFPFSTYHYHTLSNFDDHCMPKMLIPYLIC